jgi:hypothetical protein
MQTTEKDPSERGKPIGDVPASDAATKPHIGPPANARKTEKCGRDFERKESVRFAGARGKERHLRSLLRTFGRDVLRRVCRQNQSGRR